MNIQQKINRLEQELNELKQQVKNSKPKYWKPKNGEEAWYLYGNKVRLDFDWDNESDKELINIGDVFQTKEEAEKELELRLATQRLKEAIWEANGGEFVGFDHSYMNHTINVYRNTLLVDSYNNTQIAQNWMYIKDMKTAEKVLEENRRDFEIYYGL